MGFLDNLLGRKGANRNDYDDYDDNQYSDGYGDSGYTDAGDAEEYDDGGYYDDAPDTTDVASSRQSSVFNDYTPLVSMSDVRSAELPPLSERRASRSGSRAYQAQGRAQEPYSPANNAPRTQSTQGIRESLPYESLPYESLPTTNQPVDARGSQGLDYQEHYPQERDSQEYYPQERASSNYATNSAAYYAESDYSSQDTGTFRAVEPQDTRAYESPNSADPLLQRHSLSNTGDFSTTSPAYYASRSGVGHVRPAGQGRRTHKFREAVVIRPESYAEAEQIALNLRRGNAVVLVLTNTRPELAKRILDFSFGAAAASEGQVVSIGERIYALTCDYPLTSTEKELLQSRGII
jgi:FtsZ-interacting cell division protein YlmF